MYIKERLNFAKHVGHNFAREIKWMLSPATPQWIQAVTSHTKTTELGTMKKTGAIVALVWYKLTEWDDA